MYKVNLCLLFVSVLDQNNLMVNIKYVKHSEYVFGFYGKP